MRDENSSGQEKSSIKFDLNRRQFLQVAGSLPVVCLTGSYLLGAPSAAHAGAVRVPSSEVQPRIKQGTTVIQYILSRLKELGVEHTFGVPGDYVYDVCDAIQDDPDIKGLWCANEMNAGYAADGYARTKGVGVAVMTKGAELCGFHSMAGAHAERSKVVHLTGMVGFAEQASGNRFHHMIGGMAPDNYDLFVEMAKPLTAGGNGVTIITPENCVYETERLIATMKYHSLPISIAVPRLGAHQPLVPPKGPLNIPFANPKSDPAALNAVIRGILDRIENAKKPVWMPGYVLRRYDCVAEAQALIEASGLPFFTGLQDQAVLSQQHPQFGGNYVGGWKGMADPKVTAYIEASDCIIGLGPEDHSFNNAFHTMNYDLAETVNISPHETRIGKALYQNVEMKDVLKELARRIRRRRDVKGPSYAGLLGTQIEGARSDKITYRPLFQRFQAFLKPNDIVVADTALASITGVVQCKLPDGVDIESQTSMGAIGWGTPEVIGNKAAAPDRRAVILAGEGGHQMTANELGLCGRYGINPIYIVANNDGYLGERVTNRYPDEDYNDVAQWDYAALPGVLGCKDWFTAKVTTLGELDAALAKASKAKTGVYIEVVVDKDEIPAGSDFLFSATGAYFGLAGRTWADWLREGRKLKM